MDTTESTTETGVVVVTNADDGVDGSLNGVAGTIYLSIALTGLIGYGVMLRGFRVDRKKFAEHPFYMLIYMLAVGDLITIASQFIALPLVFTGQPLYGEGALLTLMSAPSTVGFYTIFFTSFLIALNRFLVFTTKPGNIVVECLFDTHIKYTVVGAGAFAMLCCSIYVTIGCPSIFSHTGFYYWTRCEPELSWFGGMFLRYSYYQNALFIPLSMLLMYVALYFVVTRTRANAASALSDQQARQRFNRELNILMQSVAICFSLELTVVMFYVTPRTAAGPGVLGILNNAMTTLNSSINPFMYLYFNGAVRTAVKKAWRSPTQTVQGNH